MFIYSKHALEKMDGLGFEKSDIERAITTGMKWKEEIGEKWHAQRAGIEVVFMKDGEKVFIITAYPAGREK